jgi:hypothetical protein
LVATAAFDERRRPDLSGAERAAALAVAGGWVGFDPRRAYDPMGPFHPERGAEAKRHAKLTVWPPLSAKEYGEDQDDFDGRRGHHTGTFSPAPGRTPGGRTPGTVGYPVFSALRPSDMANKLRKPLGFGGSARVDPRHAPGRLDGPGAARAPQALAQ